MFRFSVAVAIIPLALSQLAQAQNFPSLRWVKQVDGSGVDSFAGLGVDAQGNTYIAGSTYSNAFPVKAAAQSHIASAGLYRIDGAGSAYAVLGLTASYVVAVDPLNPTTIYASSTGKLLKSTDGGASFSTLPLATSEIFGLAINPANDQILYAATLDQGVAKSTDGGATWNAVNSGLKSTASPVAATGIWIDPTMPNIVLASVNGYLARSADGAASWQLGSIFQDVVSVSYDASNPGVLYAASLNSQTSLKSTDHGQTYTPITTPATFGTILPDPNQVGRLLASGPGGIFESDDGGSTWTMKLSLLLSATNYLVTPDWANGYLYTAIQPSAVVRITTDLKTVTPVGPPEVGGVNAIAVSNGHAYVGVFGSRDTYVTKLDPNGNVVYSTYFGGSSDDVAGAIAVDPAGNVYVTGTTSSLDFPVTKGAYSPKGGSFLFKLNPDGSVGYSTYFAPPGNSPIAIAVDAAGSLYIGGSSLGSLPVTPGAYQTMCNCGSSSTGFLTIFSQSGFVTKFNPTGSSLIYSTYLGSAVQLYSAINAMALAPDGTVYSGGPGGISRLNATGSALLGSLPGTILNPSAMAIGPDGSLYIAGAPWAGTPSFQTTPGTFEPTYTLGPSLTYQPVPTPASGIAKIDAQLKGVTAATYFGGSYNQIGVMTFDSAGNIYVGGRTGPQGLPTRTPLQGGFAGNTGFLSELAGDLSTLLFSSYFGDNEYFSVEGVGVDPNGTVRLGGVTGQVSNASAGPANIYVNSLALAPPPTVRIDSVVNAASLLDGPISPGETIIVKGAGFGTDVRLSFGGYLLVPTISVTPTTITAVVPVFNGPTSATGIYVVSDDVVSNNVLMQVTATSPGIFSQDGTGVGQGYILNKDGTLNTPSNPASTGDPITIFATGVGPVSITQAYAMTQFPVNVFVEDFYANGLAAVMGRVSGFPGSVYQITVYIPSPGALAANNPDLKNFQFPPLVGITMQIDGTSSQNGIAVSIKQ